MKLLHKIRRFLARPAIAFPLSRLSCEAGGIARLRVRMGRKLAVMRFRAASRGDRAILRQVFRERQYSLGNRAHAQALRALAESLGPRGLILDCGANIGASALWFSAFFPQARVVAVEPEAGNCALLARNMAHHPDFHLEAAAVSNKPGTLYLQRGSDCGHRVESQGDVAVRVTTIPALLRQHKGQTPLICKIDIEGGEERLFTGNCDWMDAFPLIIIELHDWMLPFSGNSRPFQKALLARDLDWVQRGENLFCYNPRLLAGLVES